MTRYLIGTVTALVMLLVLWLAPRAETKAKVERRWIKLVFGLDKKNADWSGTVTATKGRITNLAEWSFETRDKLDISKRAWKITTGIPKGKRVTYSEPERGILIEVEGDSAVSLTVTTNQGNFPIQLAKLTPGRPTIVLDGRASIEILGTDDVVAETETDDDYDPITLSNKGQRHVEGLAYDQKRKQNHLLIRNVDTNDKPTPITKGKEFANLHLLTAPEGGIYAVWTAPNSKGNWDVYFARNHGRGWTQERVTHANGSDFHLSATSKDGEVWLVWQSFRNGNADIYAQRRHRGAWLKEDLAITSGKANEWQPSISIDSKGRAWIAYDTYENGNYDVMLRSVTDLKVSSPIAIAQSRDFEANASVLVDDEDRVWIAYHAAGPRWGKDFRNVPTMEGGKYAEPLHASRRLELRCLIKGKLHEPSDPLPQILPPNPIRGIVRKSSTKPARFYEYPQLALDGEGRMWLFFRMNRQGYCPHPPRGIDWKIYATSFTKKGWLHPIELPRSQGRQNQRVAFAIGQDKRLMCAWADGCRFASVRRKYVVHHGSLPTIKESKAMIPLRIAKSQQMGRPSRSMVTTLRLKKGEETFNVYFGDLHRHTNISRCSPTIDGDLVDTHRYAIDAAELDFLAITDHTRDVDEFSWWRTQQAADLFHIPGRCIPIYAYERSNGTVTGGHRNVFFLERGWEVNRSEHWYLGRGMKVKETRPDTTLYPWMKKRGRALTAAHTPVYAPKAKKGTWTYHDPQVEPIAEIYQSFRRSYERPEKGVRAEASLWHALKQGHKLGFIASSDHMATHTAYACVWAKKKDRKSIFDALESRRTYGATDRIGLAFYLGDAVMGEETKHRGRTVKMSIRAEGTSSIREVQIVRSGKVLATLSPNRRNVEIDYVDKNPLPGESYYYVRLVQRDGGRAWGSPIWITR